MDALDDISTAALKAANITEDQLAELSRDDIRDLLPGPEHFFRRKAIWLVAHQEEGCHSSDPSTSRSKDTEPSTPCSTGPSTSITSKPSPSKVMKMPSLEYVLYIDSELEQARKHYFEKQLAGKEQEYTLSKELRCRLIRNTVTNMISVLRATVEDFAYPSKHDIIAMAKRLVEYYPMLRDRSVLCKYEWETITRLLMKRLQNVRTPRKSRSSEKNTPSSGMKTKAGVKGRQLEFGSGSKDSPCSMSNDDYDADSSGSTVLLNKSSFRSSTSESSEQEEASGQNSQLDSPQTQARHYRALQEMYKTKKPNKSAVVQLLDLEFQSRRAFIDSDVMKEQGRPTKVLEAYPCFREIDHVMDELQRILQPSNHKYIREVKERWKVFCSKLQFYGVMKKVMRPPMTLDEVQQSIEILKGLPALFPSGVPPPKKLGQPSEALFHILMPSENAAAFLGRHPLSSPLLLIDQENCMISIGKNPVTTFPKDLLHEGVLYVMVYYYALHLTYPKCIATLLSVLQTEVLGDVLHEQDSIASYKRALSEWKKFAN